MDEQFLLQADETLDAAKSLLAGREPVKKYLDWLGERDGSWRFFKVWGSAEDQTAAAAVAAVYEAGAIAEAAGLLCVCTGCHRDARKTADGGIPEGWAFVTARHLHILLCPTCKMEWNSYSLGWVKVLNEDGDTGNVCWPDRSLCAGDNLA
jgi:hypothetical protein